MVVGLYNSVLAIIFLSPEAERSSDLQTRHLKTDISPSKTEARILGLLLVVVVVAALDISGNLASRARLTPLVHPKPVCTWYSPPPPGWPSSSQLYFSQMAPEVSQER